MARLRAATEAGNASESTVATPPFPVSGIKEKLPAVLNAPAPPRPKAETPILETWPAVLNAPPPPGLAPVVAPSGVEEEPAEITAIRKASTFPFPSPTVKFPPLPGLGNPEDSLPAEAESSEGRSKKILLVGMLVIVLLAAAGFGYFKYFATRSAKPVPPPVPVVAKAPPPAAPTPAPAPAPRIDPLDKIRAAVDKIQQEQPASANGGVVAETTPMPANLGAETTSPEPGSVQNTVAVTNPVDAPESAVAPAVAPAPVKAPPPPPSLAFKAWVINLKIRGVRGGGDAQRVFIDRTSYAPGDVVNQELGIFFVSYNESKRVLTFQDKTGATFERRP
jgi:hypothetical protein